MVEYLRRKTRILPHVNVDLGFFYPLLSFALMLSIFSISSFQSIYSQTPELQDSSNCKDNEDQSKYVSEAILENISDGLEHISGDLGFHHIKKFDNNGTLISAWGSSGTGPGQFLHAHGITVDWHGNVYVSDAEKCNIQKFDSEGNFITMWGSKGTGPGEFFQPESMAIDSKGNIFVADYANQNIQKFDSEGNFITMWGSKGTEDGQFIKPWGVAVDSNDNVYISDQANPEVQKFSNNGEFLTKWNSYSPGMLFVHLHAITVDSNNNVYVTDGRNNSRIAKFDSQGDFITNWGAFGAGNGRFIENHGIVTDKSENVYVVDTRNARIQKFNSEGDFVTKWGTPGCGDNQFLIPHDIAIDASGNIYVSDSGNVHFLDDETCQTIGDKNWTTTIRRTFSSVMSGDEQMPPVETDTIGRISLSVPRNESEINYKINITGTPNILSAYIHTGKIGENGEAIVDLLKDSKKVTTENGLGVIIRGDIFESDLVGPMKGKSLKDAINAITDGDTYVNISTPSNTRGEIRGPIEVRNTGS
jgi:streptogramin lyase